MELIRIAGYTEDEKVEIARRHLIPKAMKDHALKDTEFSLDEAGLRMIVQRYTREAGVRNLERELMKLARKVTKDLIMKKLDRVDVTTGQYRGLSRVYRVSVSARLILKIRLELLRALPGQKWAANC